MNAVLRSIVTSSSSKILYLSLAYQMVKNTASYLHETFGSQVLEVPITFPTTEDLIVQASHPFTAVSRDRIRLRLYDSSRGLGP